jgi:hypothetical protein
MMPVRKPRSDSVLKTLSTESQTGIVDYARTHSVRATAQWLAGNGVKSAYQEVSKFLRWHATQQQLHKNQDIVETFKEEVRRGNPQISDRELGAIGQRMFTLMAIQDENLPGFVALRKLALRREIYEFDSALACRQDAPALNATESGQNQTEEPPGQKEKLRNTAQSL